MKPTSTGSNGSIVARLSAGALAFVSAAAIAAPGLVISPRTLTVHEGGASASYTIALSAQPRADVTVTLDVGQDPEDPALGPAVLVDKDSLVFTPGNFAEPQTIVVTADNDDSAQGQEQETIGHVVSSTDAVYLYAPRAGETVLVTVMDDDSEVFDVSIVESGGATQVVEGDNNGDTYTIVLTAEPLENVTVTPQPDPAGQVAVFPTSVTFNAVDWDTPQTITVRAVNDRDAESAPHAALIHHLVTTTDDDYEGVTARDVDVFITDNDIKAFSLIESDGKTQVLGKEDADTYTVALTVRPDYPVTVDVVAGPGIEASPATLTFDAINFGTAQTVTVESTDDGTAEYATTVFHSVQSQDGGYAQAALRDVTVCRRSCDLAKTAAGGAGGGGGGALGWLSLAGLLLAGGARRRRHRTR